MIVLAVDNNPTDLKILCDAILENHRDADIVRFIDPMLAFKYSLTNHVDALYTAVIMKRMSGFRLEKMLRADNPELVVNFIADDDTYRIKAVGHMANSYTVKPVSAEKLASAETEEG